MDRISERIRNVRNFLNLSQDELARACSVSRQAVSNIETSKSLPSIAFLSNISKKFNVNLNYIICAQGEFFNKKDDSFASLKKALLRDIETFFNKRGIK